MKKFLFSFLFFCLSAIVIHAQNLITNGGFETWTNTSAMPNSWGTLTNHFGLYFYYATDAAQGNTLRVADLDPATVTARRFNTTANFSILEEGVYRVTFKVKGNVGLRGLILVKGTASPSTTSQSATNHYTLINDYPSGTNVSDWTTLQYDINVPSSATFGTDYRLHISVSSSAGSNPRPICDFFIDDISLVKYVETSDKLQKIEITPSGYTPSAGAPDMTIPGFDQEVLQYTFTSSYKNVPVVSATAVDGTAEVNIVQATSLTGSQAERTATITVTTTDSKEKNYTVEFNKHSGFMSGISWDTRSVGDYIEWENQTGLFSRTSNQSSGNIYAFGNTSARCNSNSTIGYHLTTPVLANGASTVSFYLKNTEIATDNSEVVVKKSTTANSDWVEVGRVQPNTSDFNNVWKEVTMNIDDNSAGLKVRFEFEGKTEGVSGKVFIDDVLIEKATPTISTSANASALASFNESDVTIATGGHLTIDQNTTYKSLTVQPGARLTVNNTLTGALTLESDATGTATITDNYGTPTINATVKQYVTAGRNWYMSAPLNSASVSALDKGASVQYYDEVSGQWLVASGTLARGRGYIQVANATQGTTGSVVFTGTTNSGNVPVTLTNNSGGGKGFNLVGNPYPSYMSWTAVAGDAGNISDANMPTGTMWYRTINYNGKSAWAPSTVYSENDVVYNGTRFYKATTGGTSAASGGPTGGVGSTGIADGTAVWSYEGSVYIFATVNAEGQATPSTVSNLIPPMQAFWVKSNGGTLTFTNSMRSHETVSNRLKATGSNSNVQPFVRFSVSNGASADEAVIYASERASNTLDTYDAPKYFNTSGANQAQIYTTAGNEKLAINALNTIEEGTTLALGFVTETAGRFNIKATEVNHLSMRVILRDNQHYNEFDMTEGEAYEFSSTNVNDTNRFSLIFRSKDATTSVERNVSRQSLVFTNAAGQIEIHAPANSQYAVFNAMGQQLTNGTTNAGIQTINFNLAAGMYVVKVNNITGKVIIK